MKIKYLFLQLRFRYRRKFYPYNEELPARIQKKILRQTIAELETLTGGHNGLCFTITMVLDDYYGFKYRHSSAGAKKAIPLFRRDYAVDNCFANPITDFWWGLNQAGLEHRIMFCNWMISHVK